MQAKISFSDNFKQKKMYKYEKFINNNKMDDETPEETTRHETRPDSPISSTQVLNVSFSNLTSKAYKVPR